MLQELRWAFGSCPRLRQRLVHARHGVGQLFRADAALTRANANSVNALPVTPTRTEARSISAPASIRPLTMLPRAPTPTMEPMVCTRCRTKRGCFLPASSTARTRQFAQRGPQGSGKSPFLLMTDACESPRLRSAPPAPAHPVRALLLCFDISDVERLQRPTAEQSGGSATADLGGSTRQNRANSNESSLDRFIGSWRAGLDGMLTR